MRLTRIAALTAVVLIAACSGPRVRHAPSPMVRAAPVQRGIATPNDILFRAIGLVGTPYHWGGNTPQSGFDCSGLIVFVFNEVAGIVLPRTVQDIHALDLPEVARERLQGGDLLFFNPADHGYTHIGIYVGQDRFVHAPNEGGTVRLDTLSNVYWNAHYRGAKRVRL